MKKVALMAITLVVALITMSTFRIENKGDKNSTAADSIEEDKAKHLKVLRELIKGRENVAADSVFKNIKTLKSIPAGRLLAIMNFGYSRSLGVSCGHCHNTTKWESDEKIQKQIAREMTALVTKTRENLKMIKGLKSADPVINCTTCHRGSIKPALDMK